MYDAEIGAHCTYKYCKRKDFLPFECSRCGKIYCLEHRSCKAHECPKADIDDVQLIICPFCNARIKMMGAEDPNVVFQKHYPALCRPHLAVPETKERCAADGCYTVLNPVNTFECKACGGLKYCLKHRFSDTHKCVPFKKQKMASRLVNPPKPAAQLKPTAGEKKEDEERCPLCLMYFPITQLFEHCSKAHMVK